MAIIAHTLRSTHRGSALLSCTSQARPRWKYAAQARPGGTINTQSYQIFLTIIIIIIWRKTKIYLIFFSFNLATFVAATFPFN